MKITIKNIVLLFSAILLIISLTNCKATQTANNKEKGVVIGAAGGAIIGAIIGSTVGEGGNGEIGAIIGGVVGGTAGILIGAKMDKQAQKIEEEIPGATVERIDEAIVITFDENSGVYFETNKSNINNASQQTLVKLVGIFKEFSDTNILVVGHTDNVGKVKYNMSLSKNRANSVTNYLMNKGVNSNRLSTNWFGEAQPMHDNGTVEGRTRNRRVNIAVLPNDNMIKDAKKRTGEK